MNNIPWDAPARVWHRTYLEGGPPRERAATTSTTLNRAIDHVLSGSEGSHAGLVIKLDDESLEFAGDEISRLARDPSRPPRNYGAG